MDSGRVANWLQVGANLAILAGIALVAVQIQQANHLAAAQMADTNMGASITRETILMGENPQESIFRVMTAPHTATELDFFIADRAYGVMVRQILRAVVAKNRGVEGLIPERTAMANRYMFSGPYGRRVLEGYIAFNDNSPHPTFAELAQILRVVATSLDEAPPMGQARLDRISEALKEAQGDDHIRD